MFESKQARMAADKQRLATTRIQPDSDLAKAFAEASGQNVTTVQPSPTAGVAGNSSMRFPL